MSRKTLLVMGIGGLLGLGALVSAVEPQGHLGRRERLQQGLGLSEQQLDQLRQLRSAQRKASIKRRADVQIARLELLELLKAEPLDERAARAKVRQLADLASAAALARGEDALALRQIVSAQQAERLLSMRRGRLRGHGLRRGPEREREAAPGPGPGADLDAGDAANLAEATDQL